MHRNPPATQPACGVETLASGFVRTWAIRYTLYLPHILWSIIICHHTPMISYVFCCSNIFPRKNPWYQIRTYPNWRGGLVPRTVAHLCELHKPQPAKHVQLAVPQSIKDGPMNFCRSVEALPGVIFWIIFEFIIFCSMMFNVCPDDLLRSPMFINLQHSHPGPMSVKFQRSVPRFQAKEMVPSPMVSTPPALAKWRNSGHVRCVPKVEDIAAYNRNT